MFVHSCNVGSCFRATLKLSSCGREWISSCPFSTHYKSQRLAVTGRHFWNHRITHLWKTMFKDEMYKTLTTDQHSKWTFRVDFDDREWSLRRPLKWNVTFKNSVMCSSPHTHTLGIRARVSCTLSKCSTTGLHLVFLKIFLLRHSSTNCPP